MVARAGEVSERQSRDRIRKEGWRVEEEDEEENRRYADTRR